jgi:hypothetical protein
LDSNTQHHEQIIAAKLLTLSAEIKAFTVELEKSAESQKGHEVTLRCPGSCESKIKRMVEGKPQSK